MQTEGSVRPHSNNRKGLVNYESCVALGQGFPTFPGPKAKFTLATREPLREKREQFIEKFKAFY